MRPSIIALRTWTLALVTVFALSFAGASMPERAHAQSFCLPSGLELARLLGGTWIGKGSTNGQRWIASMRFSFPSDPCRWPTVTIPNWGSAQVYRPDPTDEQVLAAVFTRPEGRFTLLFTVRAEGTTYWIWTFGGFVAPDGTNPSTLVETVVHEQSLANGQPVPFPR